MFPPLLLANASYPVSYRRDKGLIAQYWGASEERPNEYYWFIRELPFLAHFVFGVFFGV